MHHTNSNAEYWFDIGIDALDFFFAHVRRQYSAFRH